MSLIRQAVSYEQDWVRCPFCDGDGRMPCSAPTDRGVFSWDEDCDLCGGSGSVPKADVDEALVSTRHKQEESL